MKSKLISIIYCIIYFRLRDGATLLGILQRLVKYLETKFAQCQAAPAETIRVVGHEELARAYLKLMEQLYFKVGLTVG